MRRAILIIIALVALVAVMSYVDFETVWAAFAGLSGTALLLLLALLSVGALLKALRWAYYLRAARLDISWRDGMTSYLAGMSVAAVPGGSILPARLAQEHGDVRMRQAAAGLFVAFVGDMLALALLSAAAIAILDQPRNRYVIPAAALILASILTGMGRSERLWRAVDRLLMRWRLTSGWLPKEADIHEKVSAVMRAPVIVRGVALSIVISAVSIGVLYVLTNGLTFRGVSLLEAWYVHSFSESAATVIPSPGGIGVIDSSMVGLLNALSIGWLRATFVVLAIRSVDLLFKTVVGTILLVVFYHSLLLSILQLRRRARRVRRHAWSAWRFSRDTARGGLKIRGVMTPPRFRRGQRVAPTAAEFAPVVAERSPDLARRRVGGGADDVISD